MCSPPRGLAESPPSVVMPFGIGVRNVNLIAITGEVWSAARANWGRWVADCPRCPSALWVQPGVSEVVCRECALPYEVAWPSDAMVAGVERLLTFRPDVTTRNWSPGETLHDLLAENVAHGIWTGAAGEAFAIVGDRIVTDELPTSPLRLSIGA